MLDTERDSKGPAITASLDRRELRSRLVALRKELGSEELARMLELVDDAQRKPDGVRDALSTRLMEVFRQRSSRGAFGLLYELNSQHLQAQVAGCLRRYGSRADPRDVLQEVFFNVYRYPHRFNSEREDAFRVWSAMIVRNTVLKHLRSQGRAGRTEVPFEDLSDQPTTRSVNPLKGVIDRESTRECGRVYLTYLHLYLRFYSMLSERERRAIHLVEVEDLSYRDAAGELGIKLENLKMVIFRARRKIHRSMRRVFEGLPPDCRPARDLSGRRREVSLVGESLAGEAVPGMGQGELSTSLTAEALPETSLAGTLTEDPAGSRTASVTRPVKRTNKVADGPAGRSRPGRPGPGSSVPGEASSGGAVETSRGPRRRKGEGS